MSAYIFGCKVVEKKSAVCNSFGHNLAEKKSIKMIENRLRFFRKNQHPSENIPIISFWFDCLEDFELYMQIERKKFLAVQKLAKTSNLFCIERIIHDIAPNALDCPLRSKSVVFV